jgi:hypothetical protein
MLATATVVLPLLISISGPARADQPPRVEGSVAAASPRVQQSLLVVPWLARACVAAALRASGLGGDSHLEALISRARESAWLPEARVRAMRLLAEGERETTLATTDGTNYYQMVGSHLVLELSLTWRFDRLVYEGVEPVVERLRLERLEARARVASKALDALFSWRRALLEMDDALVGSDQELQAQERAAEARATLDVLTDGWFSQRGEPP